MIRVPRLMKAEVIAFIDVFCECASDLERSRKSRSDEATRRKLVEDMKKMIVLPEDAAEGEIVQNISQEAEDLHAEIWNQFKNACN